MGEEYWNGVKIECIKEVRPGGFSYNEDVDRSRAYFTLVMKDGKENVMNFISKGYDNTTGRTSEKEIRQIFNEYNNVPEMYILENETFAKINGERVGFGYRVKDNLNEYREFTCREIDELRKEFKIKDEGWRHMLYIEMLTIEGNRVVRPSRIPRRYLEQLEYMGYDISKLEYELEEK